MPKIGEAPDERPFTFRCAVCKHPVRKLVNRFGLDGRPAAWVYYGVCRCDCGEPQRQGCVPERVYGAEERVEDALAVRYPIPPAAMTEGVWERGDVATAGDPTWQWPPDPTDEDI